MSASAIKTIELDAIITDGGTQTRAAINEATVEEYADRMGEGEKFPPIRVFTDGSHYWLSRGFHRVLAAKRVGFVDFAAEVEKGTVDDALIDSASDNRAHGLRRTNSDKRFATELFIKRFPNWSNRRIADAVGVSPGLVDVARPSLPKLGSGPSERQGRDGRTTNTAAIGKSARVTCAPNMPVTDRNDSEPSRGGTVPTRIQANKENAQPTPDLSECAAEFQVAWENLFTAVKNERSKKWAATPRKTAAHYIQVLADLVAY